MAITHKYNWLRTASFSFLVWAALLIPGFVLTGAEALSDSLNWAFVLRVVSLYLMIFMAFATWNMFAGKEPASRTRLFTLKRYGLLFFGTFCIGAWLWLAPSAGSQIGDLPWSSKLKGLALMLPGSLGPLYWELWRAREPNLVFIGYLVSSVAALLIGLIWPSSRTARALGYLAAMLWGINGLLFSISGL